MTTDHSTTSHLPVADLPEDLQAVASREWARIQERNAGESIAVRDADAVVLARMLACSEYAAGRVVSDWSWFRESLANGEFDRPQSFAGSLEPLESDEAGLKAQFRRYRHRRMLHLLWREFAGKATLADTLNGLSTLADGLLIAAQEAARAELSERFGEPMDETGHPAMLVMMAMGKLGGHELNFSSDVDLIFLYTQEGETNGRRSLSAHEYFTRLTRRIVNLLEDVTEDGFAYRIDTRLRPFGDSGPPVVSFTSLESYLLQHGRSWERYAYVKARVVGPVANNPQVGELMRNVVQPFVYRRYLDYGVFESLRDMKALISAEVERRELANNVKLGPGGIREIEFIAQSLQLVRGGRIDALRCCELRSALNAIARNELLPENTVQDLLQAYRFLRRLENFIQALRDQQVHDLPADGIDQRRIALAMGCDDWDVLIDELNAHREIVSLHFRQTVFRGTSVSPGNDEDESKSEKGVSSKDIDLALGQAEDSRWDAIVQRYAGDNTEPMATILSAFSRHAQVRQADNEARRRLVRLMPVLLQEVSASENPADTLQRVLLIVEKILRRSAYLAMMIENPAVLKRVVDLCAQSAYFAEEIGRYPLLLDEMLDPRLFTTVMSSEDLHAEISERSRHVEESDSERQVESLAQFQRAILFRVAISDFSGNLPIMKVSDSLTELAEIVLARALEIAWHDLVDKHGEPGYSLNGQRRRAGFGVIAYGKLGGMELSYGSDLDLVFLHDSCGQDQHTDGEKPLDNTMFFARLVRRLVHFLTTQTPSGALYEVDTRLRPDGRSGLLVTSIEAFERYQEENAWTWEHQALLRSRPVAGDVSVYREFERIRRNTLTAVHDRDELASQVRKMRARMRETLDKSDAGKFDLKQGAGGIGDIEFLVQFLTLMHASENPAVIFYPDNIRQLGTLAAAAYLADVEVSQLQECYREYRTALHRLALNALPPLVDDSAFAEERKLVTSLWQRELG